VPYVKTEVRIVGVALRFLKLESSRQPKMKIWWS